MNNYTYYFQDILISILNNNNDKKYYNISDTIKLSY